MNIPSLLKVVVDRAKWFRGRGSYQSALLREDGQMCCIGFACLAKGMTPEQILRKKVIGYANTNSCAKAPTGWQSLNFHALYNDNDDEDLNDSQREAFIIEDGEKCGIEFSFIN